MSKTLPNPIWLNVGGQEFCCSIETLTWHDETFFSGLFREGLGCENCIEFFNIDKTCFEKKK